MKRVSLLGILGLGTLAAAACGDDGGTTSGGSNPNPAPTTTAPADGPPAPVAGADYAIVVADPLVASAGRYKSFRESTGHKATLATVSAIAQGATDANEAIAKIKAYVKAQYDVRDASKPFFVLLVGDGAKDAAVDGTFVPAVRWEDATGRDPITSDNPYADVDGDHLPDLAIGRIAAKSDDEVDAVLEKTRRYETTYEPGAWNRRLNLFASTSGFGEPFDSQIETLVYTIVEEIPYDFDITLTYAKQSSPFVYVPEKFSDKVYDRLNEGSLMMAYVGHGNTDSFATLEWSGRSFPILDTTKLGKIDIGHKSPLLTLIACLTGAFDRGDSLSEKLLRAPKGPVAILSSTEISHPYANAVFIRELAQVLAGQTDAPTIGQAFQSAKRRMVQNNDALRKTIDEQVGSLLNEEARADLKRTHLYMYELFGDPAARIAYPSRPLAITATGVVAAGGDVDVKATLPAGLGAGNALVTLERLRTSRPTVAAVPADGSADRDGVIDANYRAANDTAVVGSTVAHDGKTLAAKLKAPALTAGATYWVKVLASGGGKDAIGSLKVVAAP